MSLDYRSTAVAIGSVIVLAVGAWSAVAGEGQVTAVENNGSEITIDSAGETIKSMISASKTNVTINGAAAEGADVQVGMNCVTDVESDGGEATAFDCLTEDSSGK
jgi:hypothetical protein